MKLNKKVLFIFHFENGVLSMLIQCTKKLLDELNSKPEGQVDEEPLFSWHANLIIVNRRKTVVLVNDKNRYVIVLHGLKAKDFKKLDELILQAIRETFQQEYIKDEIIEQFIQHAKEITFTKTKDRTSVARMNKACETIYFNEDLLTGDSLIKSAISIETSTYLVGHGKNQYILPNEEMYKDLETFSGRSIFSSNAVELIVTLDLEKYHVWRRLVVPVNRTFSQLHKILQMAFGWKDYHLHEFYLYDHKTSGCELSSNHSGFHKEGYKPIVKLVCDKEALEYENDIPMKLDCDIKLSEYISAKVKYNYDFGDSWQHYIDVVKVLPDFDHNYPICIGGEGSTPPEDVGGEQGYEEFLEVIANRNHPEYEDTVKWGKGQDYKEFDIETVNRLLKKL